MSERDRLEFWTRALNLPDFRVVHETRTTPDAPVCFTVRPTVECGVCPRCHKPTDYVNRTTESDRVKDLPLGAQSVELIVRTLQFYCEDCDCYFTPHVSALPTTGKGKQGGDQTYRRASTTALRLQQSETARATNGLAGPFPLTWGQ
jgi:transposase